MQLNSIQSMRWPQTSLFVAISTLFLPQHANAAEEFRHPTQMSPPGYSGAINTPTADTLEFGVITFALTNSIPERQRTIFIDSFGNINAGIGLFPGLELVGRLNFEGDLNCNQLDPSNCNSVNRDLSLSGKYQLPFQLPFDTRLAIGITDFGGAATFHRQAYGVATSQIGLLNVSIGYSRPESSQALMDGVFANATLRLTERWTTALESDTREERLGIHYRQPITEQSNVHLSLSRKLSDATGQEPWQATAALNLQLGHAPKPIREVNPFGGARAKPISNSIKNSANPAFLQPALSIDLTQAALQAKAQSLAQSLTRQGFSQVKIQFWPGNANAYANTNTNTNTDTNPSGLWWVQVEPRQWRQNHLDALSIALATWKKQAADNDPNSLLLTLTYQREPTTHLFTNASCLQDWLQGWQECGLGEAIQFSRARQWPADVQARMQSPATVTVQQDGSPTWAPQIEISPNLRSTVGTEYGLADYSLAMDIGAEVNLAPGLFWQGVYSIPLGNSDDFDDGKSFSERRHPDASMINNLLSYWKALPQGISAQASIGYISHNEKGVQADAVWMSRNGRWRVSATAARYESDGNRLIDQRNRQPLIGSLRYGVIPGSWQLEATGGQFMLGDEGYKLTSSHWFGDTRFQINYRNSQFPAGQIGEREFLNFTFSLPLGPKQAKAITKAASVRGRDQWTWGLETKVGDTNNIITYGYGLTPVIRHGVLTDVIDYDRNGQADMTAQLPRFRDRLKAQLEK